LYKLFFLLSLISAKVVAQPPLPYSKHAPVVIAHRGDHVEVPENTVAAFEKAIAHGVDYVEIDLRTTKDGKLVLMHNGTVDKMTNGTGNVKDLTFAEIRQLQVKSKNPADKKVYQVPTFKEALNACKGKMYIYLDFKEADVTAAYAQIKAAGMEKSIVVYINKREQLAEWQKVAPKMPLMCSLGDDVKDAASLLAYINQTKVQVLDGRPQQYTPEMMAAAKAVGVAIWLDVQQNEEGPAAWDPALQLKVGGMQTDHPELLVQYLKKIGKR
jgi:glycerophosphoryl diester phosphodiesterase